MNDEFAETVRQIAAALQKMMHAASAQRGADCAVHSALGQRLLSEAGFPSRLVVGEAAWRVGPGDGDVIVHSPSVGGVSFGSGKSFAYHAWLETEHQIIDFTTYSLSIKAKELDRQDGGRTTLTWTPPFLAIDKTATSSLKAVTMALDAGVCCYRELPGLKEAMESAQYLVRVEEHDLRILRLIMQNPECQVCGPNIYQKELTEELG